MNINCPVELIVSDYHEFDEIQEQMRKIIPGIKVKEIGFDAPNYIGIAYIGNLREPKNQALRKKIQTRIKNFNKQNLKVPDERNVK